jgi:hypothetical protein
VPRDAKAGQVDVAFEEGEARVSQRGQLGQQQLGVSRLVHLRVVVERGWKLKVGEIEVDVEVEVELKLAVTVNSCARHRRSS